MEMTDRTYKKEFIELAVNEARKGIFNHDGGSFGAVIVKKHRLMAGSIISSFGEGRVDAVARLCMVVDWCIDHPEYTAKIKVIPKKDYPVLMPCEF